MSETKFTPGPWIISDNVQPPLPGYEARSSAKYIGTFDIKTEPCEKHEIGLWLAAVHPYECSGFASKEQAAANARLIAAAPELLKAAVEALDFICAHNHYVATDIITKLQTTIEKATK